MDELTISPEKVCYIIVKARAFDAKVQVVESDPGSNSADDRMSGVLEDYADDSTFLELKELIDDCNEDEAIDLIAMAWIGRGTYTLEEWEEAREEATAAHNHHTSDYLLGMPLLGDFLEEALSGMGYSCAEFEEGHL